MIKVRIILFAGLLILVGLSGMAGCRSAHTTSAILYIDEQNYDKAVQVIHEGFQYRDDEPDAFYYLGEAYSHLAEEAVENNEYDEPSFDLGFLAKELDFSDPHIVALMRKIVQDSSASSARFMALTLFKEHPVAPKEVCEDYARCDERQQ